MCFDDNLLRMNNVHPSARPRRRQESREDGQSHGGGHHARVSGWGRAAPTAGLKPRRNSRFQVKLIVRSPTPERILHLPPYLMFSEGRQFLRSLALRLQWMALSEDVD